jgi:hypothetical protein
MCTRAHPYGRAGRCGFGGRGAPAGGGRIGSLQIYETNAAVKTPVGTTDAVPKLPRGWYFRYRAGTTDCTEVTKTKFEMRSDSSISI